MLSCHGHWRSEKMLNGHIKLNKTVQKTKACIHTTLTEGLMTELIKALSCHI